MDALRLVVENLERQQALYAQLENALRQQREALMARDIGALDQANGLQAFLVDALNTLEEERQDALRLLPGPPRCVFDLAALVTDLALGERLRAVCSTLPLLVENVRRLARTNRLLASDASASASHLLKLMGVENAGDYTPTTHSSAPQGACLRLDVRA